jgi:hypothetical protein
MCQAAAAAPVLLEQPRKSSTTNLKPNSAPRVRANSNSRPANDVRLKILSYLQLTLGERYRPSPLFKQFVREARLVRKSGRGVYDYSQHDAHRGKP